MKRLESFSFIATVAAILAMISWGSLLQAQQSSPDSQQPSSRSQPAPPSQQPPDTEDPPASGGQAQPSQTPDQDSPSRAPNQAQQSDPNGSREFVGTIAKQGDKYMFQETATGTTYDIDHQDEVKKFDGKKVRVHGTLDPNGKIIHVQ